MFEMGTYHVLMGIGGSLAVLGIFLTWNLSRGIERFRLGTGRISWLILAGGVLTALGFIELMAGLGAWAVAVPVIIGPALIVYALSESGLVKAKPEMLVQVAVIVFSLFLSGSRTMYIIESFSAIAIVMLMDAAAFYVHTPKFHSRLARLSAWLFTAFVPINTLRQGNIVAMLLYIGSTALWVSTLIALHGVLRERFSKNVQESL